MDDCIFCKIVKGDIPCVKIWENDDYLAFLDINPNVKGMTLVISKDHYDSYVFDMPDDKFQQFLLASKVVAKFIQQGLKVKRVSMVMEGMGVNHAHIKLYPMFGLDQTFTETWAKDKVYFDKYPGYISTQLGPEKSMKELEEVAQEIITNNS